MSNWVTFFHLPYLQSGSGLYKITVIGMKHIPSISDSGGHHMCRRWTGVQTSQASIRQKQRLTSAPPLGLLLAWYEMVTEKAEKLMPPGYPGYCSVSIPWGQLPKFCFRETVLFSLMITKFSPTFPHLIHESWALPASLYNKSLF